MHPKKDLFSSKQERPAIILINMMKMFSNIQPQVPETIEVAATEAFLWS